MLNGKDSAGEGRMKNLKELCHICQQAFFRGMPSPQVGFASWIYFISTSSLFFYIYW